MHDTMWAKLDKVWTIPDQIKWLRNIGSEANIQQKMHAGN